MIIRQGLLSDSSSIHKLIIQLGYPQEPDKIVDAIKTYTQEGYQLLVIEDDSIVAGFASLHWFDMFHARGKLGRITAMCVLEELRSKGFGGQLLLASEEFLRSRGCVKIEITSNFKRSLTHEFYLKNGYSIDSKRFVKTFQ